jgi:hypothetical protein
MTQLQVAIAVSERVNKILWDTLKSLPDGHEAQALLEKTQVRECGGWVLYDINFTRWPNQTDRTTNIEQVLKTLASDAKYAAEITALSLQDHLPDIFSEPIGAGKDPFGLRIVVKIEYV